MKVVKKLWADGRAEDCNEKMTLEQMQEFVGGYIEFVASAMSRRHLLVVNEEGLFKPLPVNENATALVAAGVWHAGIRGNALLVKR